MALKKNSPLLERLRAQYDAYKVKYPRLQLYALLDVAKLPWHLLRMVDSDLRMVRRVPLYGGTGLDDLAANGPFLIACPPPQGEQPLQVHRSLLALTLYDNRYVSWLWCEHPVEVLVEHLQTLLHARLGPDNQEAWFFFHQPAYLPVLHRSLPEDTRRYMFGPLLAWWCLDYRAEWIELPGENLRIPQAWDMFPINEAVVQALHQAAAPAQVRDWLQRARPELLDKDRYANEHMRRIAPLVAQAQGYGLSTKLDQGIYVAMGLLYDPQYVEHPALQAVLTSFKSGKQALIDAYMAQDKGVWQEVEDGAHQRAREAAIRAHQAEVREYGHTSLRVRIINDTTIVKREIRLDTPYGQSTHRTTLGDIDAYEYETVIREIESASIPIPDTIVTVRWSGPTGEHSDLARVTGGLPRAQGEGMAVVRFARDWRVYISMHADPPKPPAW